MAPRLVSPSPGRQVRKRKDIQKLLAFRSNLWIYLKWSHDSIRFEPTASEHRDGLLSRLEAERGVMWKRGKRKSNPAPSHKPPLRLTLRRKLAEKVRAAGGIPSEGRCRWGQMPLRLRKLPDPCRCSVFCNVLTVFAIIAQRLIFCQ